MNYQWHRPGTIHYMLRTKFGNINIDVHAIDGDKHWDVRWHINENKSANLHFSLIPITEFTATEAKLVAEMCEHYSEKNRWQYSEYYGPELSPIPSFVCSKCQTYLNEDPDPTVNIEHYICTECLITQKPMHMSNREGWTFDQIVIYQDKLFDIAYLEYVISSTEREYRSLLNDCQEYTQLLEKQSLMIVNQQLDENAEEFLKAQRMVSVHRRYSEKLSAELDKKKRKHKRRIKELAHLNALWKKDK
jgi:hypothetical protein